MAGKKTQIVYKQVVEISTYQAGMRGGTRLAGILGKEIFAGEVYFAAAKEDTT